MGNEGKNTKLTKQWREKQLSNWWGALGRCFKIHNIKRYLLLRLPYNANSRCGLIQVTLYEPVSMQWGVISILHSISYFIFVTTEHSNTLMLQTTKLTVTEIK